MFLANRGQKDTSVSKTVELLGVNPHVWNQGTIGQAKVASLIIVRLKPGHSCPHKEQYPLHQEALKGLALRIQELIDQGPIRPCQSAYNTLILPIKKSDREYWIVQDLKAINEATRDIYLVVSNLYTLLAALPPSNRTWYFVLNLNDTFFCIALPPESQETFDFEWQDHKTQQKQFCWMVLPRGLKNSSTLKKLCPNI